jgi:hypothetical protein
MMTAQTAEARETRKQRVHQPPPCEHLTLKLEPSGLGSFTGNFYCIDCGEVLPRRSEWLLTRFEEAR